MIGSQPKGCVPCHEAIATGISRTLCEEKMVRGTVERLYHKHLLNGVTIRPVVLGERHQFEIPASPLTVRPKTM